MMRRTSVPGTAQPSAVVPSVRVGCARWAGVCPCVVAGYAGLQCISGT